MSRHDLCCAMTDARLPVLLHPSLAGVLLGPDDLVLRDANCDLPVPSGVAVRTVPFAVVTGHAPACACCAGPSPLARTLLALMGARARGEVPFFLRLHALADASGRAALREAVRADPLVGSRYVV
jgi:hypothetical protein